MKKLTLILSLIIGITFIVSQQAAAQFTVGARAGVNFATEPAPDLYHVFLARPYAGIFGQYNVTVPFALQLGINYSGEGANYKDLSTGDTYQIRHSYLTIPLWAQYHFPFGGYVELGPQLGFLLSANARANSDAFADSKQYYKSTNVEAGIGFGYEFLHKTVPGLGINARYVRGLTNISKETVDGKDVKTRVLSIGLTYRLLNKMNAKK